MQYIKSLLLLLLLLISATAMRSGATVAQISGSIPSTAVYITNGTSSPIEIRLRLPDKEWEVFPIAGGAGALYDCDCDTEGYDILVPTDNGKSITRRLGRGEGYVLRYDPEADRIDVYYRDN